MPLSKSDIPDLLVPGLRAEFELAYRSELDAGFADRIATVIQTTMPIQKYAWLGATPPMREFVDERRPAGMAAYAMTIEDKVFESSIAVDRRAIEDDQLDLIRLRVRDLATRVVNHRQQIVVEALVGGATAGGYDGVSFFNTAHPLPGGGTVSNRGSTALASASLAEALSGMMTIPDDTGTPLGILPDTLVVGPKLAWTAIELAESPVVVYQANVSDSAGPTNYLNPFHGKLRVVVTPFLSGTSDDYWFLLDTKRPIRGVILQERKDVPVEFSALEAGSGSDSAWMRDRYHYGVRARYNVGYGLWQTAFGAIV
ncbi:MAG TPA: Mu-like prophage major head subunit gpT family protein [Fimbriimonadaceae bacterium]|nr:Mu-like prophage major head subunit gpT family protein [Fimbriimonadaceae bacterium]